MKKEFLIGTLILLSAIGSAFALSEQELIDIRDGFDARRDSTLDSQISNPWPDSHDVWWRQNYALSALYRNVELEEANQAIIDAAAIEQSDPENYDNSFHWRGNLFYRIYKMFYSESEYFPGRLTAEAEEAIRDVFWNWAKHKSMLVMADFSETDTWVYWGSENHDIMRKSSCYSAADILKDSEDYKDLLYDDGGTAQEHYEAWNAYFKEYLSQRARKGMFVELGSHTYTKYTTQGIYNFYDFASDSELARLSGELLDLWWTDWALDSINSVRGGGKMRIAEGTVRAVNDSTYAMAWCYLGVGQSNSKHPGIMCLVTSEYRMPLVVMDIALDTEGKGVYEFFSRRPGLLEYPHDELGEQGLDAETGAIFRYTYHTPSYVLGTAMVDARPYTDWAGISSQNRWIGAIFGAHPDAKIFPFAEFLSSTNRNYNAFWSVQNKGTMIAQKLGPGLSRQAGDMQVFFSGAGTDMTITEQDGWIFARMPDAFAAVRPVWGTYSWDDSNFIRLSDDLSPIIIEVWQSSDFDNVFTLFRHAVLNQSWDVDEGVLTYTGLKDAGELTLYTDYSQLPEINGTPIDLAPDYTYKSPFLNSDWDSTQITISKDDRELNLNFTYDQPEEPEYNIADLNKDGIVDIKDFAIMAQNWLLCTTPGDPDCIVID